ncbi:hypothetical protein N9Q19_01100 [Puniceicoccaceae bacterium]|nr:hypothetical protein [Puniceicoccaceae bacterium]
MADRAILGAGIRRSALIFPTRAAMCLFNLPAFRAVPQLIEAHRRRAMEALRKNEP